MIGIVFMWLLMIKSPCLSNFRRKSDQTNRDLNNYVSCVLFSMFGYGQKIVIDIFLRKIFQQFLLPETTHYHAKSMHMSSVSCEGYFSIPEPFLNLPEYYWCKQISQSGAFISCIKIVCSRKNWDSCSKLWRVYKSSIYRKKFWSSSIMLTSR